MSIMDLFRGARPSQETQQTMQQNQQTQQTQQTNGLPIQQANPAADPTNVPAEEVSPLDAFKDLWQNEPPKEGEVQEFNPAAMFNMDAGKIQEATQGIDFTKHVSQDDLQAITQGGEGAAKALLNIINSVQRNALSTSIMASANLVQNGFSQAVPHLDAKVSKKVTDHQVSSQLQESNPLLNHPAAQPMLQMVKEQLIKKHPQASPAEITKLASDYLGNFASLITKPEADKAKQASAAKAAAGEYDWNLFAKD